MQEQENTRNDIHTGFIGSFMRGDIRIWGIYFFLFIFSAIEMTSASSQLTYRTAYVSDPAFAHIKNLFLGLFAIIITQSLSLKAMQAWGKLLWFAGVVLAIATIFFGVEQKGASRSLYGFQPVEFCKLGVVMALCSAITARDSSYHIISWFRTKTAGRRFWFYLLIIAAAAVPIATQNLSSALIIAMVALALLFIGRVNGKYIWMLIGVCFIAGGLFLASLKAIHEANAGAQGRDNIETVDSGSSAKGGFSIDKVLDRAITWSNRIFDHSEVPLWEENENGKKSQEIYSHMALVNGFHPFGQVIGNSVLRDFLPEAFSDYIFAIIFEETGPIGALFVLMLYLSLLIRCIMLARRSQNIYIRLLMIGLPLAIVIQALMHIGVCTGAMFVTGQPLPLLSRGGTSIVFTSISIGLILALSRIIKQEVEEREMLQQQENADAASIPQPEVVMPTDNA